MDVEVFFLAVLVFVEEENVPKIVLKVLFDGDIVKNRIGI